jgi:CRISPR-associated protein Cas1
MPILCRNFSLDDAQWTERSAYWSKGLAPKQRRFLQRAGIRQPLILSGHGVKLRVQHGSLVVKDGFTHYPHERETWRFFPGEWRLPSRIVVVDADGGLTFDALTWLSKQEVPLIQINWRGEVTNIVGASTAADPKLVNWQRATQKKSESFQIAKELIRQKVSNSLETLRLVSHQSQVVKLAVDKLRGELGQLKQKPPSTISALMGVEGKVALTYFHALRTFSVRWKETAKHSIPDDWHYFGRRASKVGDIYHPNRNAIHPIQAMLNYGYGILENQTRMKIVAAGLNPKIGIFHGPYRNKDGLVFDLMEPQRPIVDRKILNFVRSNILHRSDFTIRLDGVCRLNPELSRHLVRHIIAEEAGHGNGPPRRLQVMQGGPCGQI